MSDRDYVRFFRFDFEVLGLGYALTAVLGILGNVLTLKTFWRERRSSWFHVQLCVANMLALIAASLSSPSALRGRWLFGPVVCNWFGFQTCLASYAEILFTCVICLETYIAKLHPEQYKKATHRTFTQISVLIWAYSLFFSLAPLFGWNRYSIERFSISCGVDLLKSRASSYFSYIVATYGVFLLMVAATLGMLVMLHFTKDRQDTQMYEPLMTDEELIKTAGGLFGVMVVCSLPYYLRILTFLSNTRPIFKHFLGSEFTKLSLKLGCALQPYVYIVSSARFKSQCIATVTGVTPEKKRN